MKKRMALALALVMFAGACSSDGDSEISQPTVERTITTEQQSVAEPTATAQATATTAPAPAPTATPIPDPLDQVIDAYLAFLAVFGGERFDNAPDFDALAQVSTAAWVDQVRSVLPSAKPSWQVTIDPNIEDVSIDGTSATITDCHGFRRVFDDPTQPAPDNAIVWDRYEIRTVEMLLTEEEWKFSSQRLTGINADGVAGTVLCVPSADRAQLEALPEAYFRSTETAFDNGGSINKATARLRESLYDEFEELDEAGMRVLYPNDLESGSIVLFNSILAIASICIEWDATSGFFDEQNIRDESRGAVDGTSFSILLGSHRSGDGWLVNEQHFEEVSSCKAFTDQIATDVILS